MRGIAMRTGEGPGCALVNRNVGCAAQAEDASGILGRVDDVDVAGQGGDGDQVGIGPANGQPDGKGVIHSGVDIEDEWSWFGHGISFCSGVPYSGCASISTQPSRFLTAK
jgi:hypothetical protein